MDPLVGRSVLHTVIATTAFDPTAIEATPRSVLAAATLVSTVLFGGFIMYRYGGRLDAGIDASMERPLLSVVYGIVSYSIVVFVVGYAYSQLLRIGVTSMAVSLLLTGVFAVIVLSISGAGFVVTGTWLTRAVGIGDPWLGLIGLGIVSAIAWLVLPLAIGLAVWGGISAIGVGGPARLWFNATAGDY
ncbi:hypothetical protein [Halalkalirubrum salinum]|uniref:hypothetical protein n=1 Tax=Halalkalirubrum salinum TaxID=2563889 RepID=UPI0010FB0036|nr:hypothetical protein [Halalkalirubrum salinum]